MSSISSISSSISAWVTSTLTKTQDDLFKSLDTDANGKISKGEPPCVRVVVAWMVF